MPEPYEILYKCEQCSVCVSTIFGEDDPMIVITDKDKDITYWIESGLIVIESRNNGIDEVDDNEM